MEREAAAALLGVPTNASKRAVRSAFRGRVREYHPDAGSNKVADFAKLAAARDLLLKPAPEPERPIAETDTSGQHRFTPEPSTITYGYDPDAKASWDADVDPFITRDPQPIGSQRFRNESYHVPFAKVVMVVCVAIFVLAILIGLLSA